MAVTLSLTESQCFAVLRSFLLSVLPTGVAVIQAQVNRVASPNASNYVVMTPILRERIATNIDSYIDDVPGNVHQKLLQQRIKMSVQLDFHGPDGADNATLFTTLFRDEYAVEAFDASGLEVAPLVVEDPRQMPFINAEQQVEWRWIVNTTIQCNPTVSVDQEFADALVVGLIEVDAFYPPT